jgi:hypothetical protein
MPWVVATHGRLTALRQYRNTRMLSDRAERDAGCSVIVAAQIGDVVARREPGAQEQVSPVQYSTDFPHLGTDGGVQSTFQIALSVSFH